jgi:uncharacterized membrane protein YdjX (TVP38/TMEM64 family)
MTDFKNVRNIIPALFIAMKKKDTPLMAKIFAAITVVYALSPIDLIPDAIPIFGLMDDFVIVPLLAYIAIKFIPDHVLEVCVSEAQVLMIDGIPRKWFYSVPIVLIWGVVIFFVARYFMEADPREVITFINSSPNRGLLILIGLYSLKAVTFVIPVALLFIASGAFLPLYQAIALTYALVAIEFTLTFIIGRRLGQERVSSFLSKNKRTEKLLSMNLEEGFLITLILRIVPNPSVDFISLMLSTTNVSYKTFITASLIGISPSLLTYIFIGDAIWDPLSTAFILPFVIRVILSVITFVYYRKSPRFQKFRKAKKIDPSLLVDLDQV